MKTISYKFLKSFSILTILFFLFLVLVYLIPNTSIKNNYRKSINVTQQEGVYKRVNSNDQGTTLDNFTDSIMLSKALRSNDNAVKSSVAVGGYPRYWHGYQVFLRPILTILSYTSIRQIYGFILSLLLMTNIILVYKRLNLLIALGLLCGLNMIRFYIFPLSMQFSNVFMVMACFNIFLLTRKSQFFENHNYYIYLYIIGAITNYIDLLTVPLVTFGIPITFIICLELKYSKNYSPFKQFKNLIVSGLMWLLGYAITWISKWIIASYILKRNIVKEAIRQIVFRTEGDATHPLNRWLMLSDNFRLMYNNVNILAFGLLVAIMLIIILINLHFSAEKYKLIHYKSLYVVNFIIIAISPYIWYLILSNHSQIHFWFTFRLQIITVFSITSFLAILLDDNYITNSKLTLE